MKVDEMHVMIFKAPVEGVDDGQSDPYTQLLEKNGFTVTNVPVIDFEYCNLEELGKCLHTPEEFSGIIFTSPRAVRAAALSLGADQGLPTRWSQLSFFVVGKTTAETLRTALGVEGEGAESGSAANLADYIVQRSYSRPLLYPCSNLRQCTLSSRLQQGGVALHPVTAYRTVPHPQLEQHVRQALARLTAPHFLVYFSPSGVSASLPVLRDATLPLRNAKVITLGTSTKAALEESDVAVWSVCKQPTPDHLLCELKAQRWS